MALTSGTPAGTSVSQEELYLDGAPYIFYQDYNADPLYNPDADGYYWGMSGTPAYPVKSLACVTEVAFGEGVESNDIRCDTVGVKGTIIRRNYVELTFTLQTFMPLSIFAEISGYSAADVSAPTEKVGIGNFDNNQFWHVYAPNVYDVDSGDLLIIDLAKCQFVEPSELTFNYGSPWTKSFVLRAYADSTRPDSQRFGVIIRSDSSAIT